VGDGVGVSKSFGGEHPLWERYIILCRDISVESTERNLLHVGLPHHRLNIYTTATGFSPLLVRPPATVSQALSAIWMPPKLLSGACQSFLFARYSALSAFGGGGRVPWWCTIQIYTLTWLWLFSYQVLSWKNSGKHAFFDQHAKLLETMCR